MALRLKMAMDAFFRRLQAGETPGYPRFRGKGRYDSLTYPQWENGAKLNATGRRLLLSKIGAVKLLYHRPLEGVPKTATIRKITTGKWFVTISCEWEPFPLRTPASFAWMKKPWQGPRESIRWLSMPTRPNGRR